MWAAQWQIGTSNNSSKFRCSYSLHLSSDYYRFRISRYRVVAKKSPIMNVTEKILREIANNKTGAVFYYANGGNGGDALINVGFYFLAENIGLTYEAINLEGLSGLEPGDTVIVAGGGTIVPEWQATSRFLSSLSKHRDINLLILPQSIREVDAVLKNLPENTRIICREKYSYQYCLSLLPPHKVLLGDDVAFYVDVARLNKLPTTWGRLDWKNITRHLIYFYHKLKSKFVRKINAFRCDAEASSNLKVKRKIYDDISVVAALGSNTQEDSIRSAQRILSLVNLYDELHTDRLHVGIAACLLGKKVTLHENSYYKIKGVYELSMSNFSHAKLVK
ncbi:polysaccharide pyruvyl transferase family protein [Variovorax paradoxus]|uniref:polysaccharide pyruvyl transferase family protein n=1 Tax=Variovorax paradoxus TaxID=34073 RepID=UPI003ED0881B